MVEAACKYKVNNSAVQSSVFMCLTTLAFMELRADMVAMDLVCEERGGRSEWRSVGRANAHETID